MNKTEDPSFGVKCFTIAGRMMHERERALGMTDEERKWRSQWVKDQIIPEGEPKFVPEYYRDTTNIFRRWYIGPRMKFENFLSKYMPRSRALSIRSYLGKTIISIGFCYYLCYNIKYNSNDWTKRRKFEYHVTRRKMLPGDPGYPHFEERPPQYYADHGFSKSVFGKKILGSNVVDV